MSLMPQFAPAPMPTSQFYASSPGPVPFYAPAIPPAPVFAPAQQAPQYRPPPWSPPALPQQALRVPVSPAGMQVMAQNPAPPQMMAGAPGQPIHFQVPHGLGSSPLGYYGYAPDNMWAAMAAVPPMWRPQQPGETFARRWAVNVGLNAMETILTQLMLGVRQMFLPPVPGMPEAPAIDMK